MKKHTTLKRLLAVALTIALALSVAIPALAASGTADNSTYTVTIKGNQYTDYSESKRFDAYQIFDGDLSTSYDPGDEEEGNKPPMQNKLADVNWGSGIDDEKIVDLLNALMEQTISLSDLGISTDVIIAMAGTAAYAELFEDVAKILTDAAVEEAADKALGNTYWDGVNHEYNAYYYEQLEAAAAKYTGVELGEVFTAALEYALKEELEYAKLHGSIGDTDGVAELLELEIGTTGALTLEQLKATGAAVAMAIADLNGGSANNNSALARAFAAIVAKKDISGDHEFLSENKTTSEHVDEDDEEQGWKIELEESGYYLIVDTLDTENMAEGTAKSDFLLGVFGKQTVQLKTDIPTPDKIITNSNGNEKGGDFEIGETIKFQLSGTLPENFGAYTSYKFVFHDTLSEGLKYTDNLKVTVTVLKDGERVEVEIPETVTVPSYGLHTNYTVTTDTDTSDNCNLHVEFTDLKTLFDELGDEVLLDAGSVVYVTYTAELTEDAKVTLDGNTNSVKIEYSSDPTWDGSGDPPTSTTTEKTVYAYDFALDIQKQDENGNPLAGAAFAVKKNVADEKMYVLYKNKDGSGATKLIPASELQKYFGEYDLEEISDWTKVKGENGNVTEQTLANIATDVLSSKYEGETYTNSEYDDWYLLPAGQDEPETADATVFYTLYDENGEVVGSISEDELQDFFGETTVSDISSWTEYVGKSLGEIADDKSGDKDGTNDSFYLIPPISLTKVSNVTLYTLYAEDEAEGETVYLTKEALQAYFGDKLSLDSEIDWEDLTSVGDSDGAIKVSAVGKTIGEIAKALGVESVPGTFKNYYLIPNMGTDNTPKTETNVTVYTLYGPDGEIAQVKEDDLKEFLGNSADTILNASDFTTYIGQTLSQLNAEHNGDYKDYVLIRETPTEPQKTGGDKLYTLYKYNEDGTLADTVQITEEELKEALGEKVSILEGEDFTDYTGQKLCEINTQYSNQYADYVLILEGKTTPTVNTYTVYYAILLKSEDVEAYSVYAWVKADAVKDMLEGLTTESVKLENGKEIGDVEIPEEGDYYLAILTTDEGTFNIKGLDSDNLYYLEEVITPDGYDTIGDVTVRYEADYYTEEDVEDGEEVEVGQLKTLTAYVTIEGEEEKYEIVKEGKYVTDENYYTYASLAASFAIVNYPAGYLPGTGGSGTTMFYIAGGILLALALGFLVVINVKKPRKAE